MEDRDGMIDKAERERIANCSICKHLADVEFEGLLQGGKIPEQEEQLENVPQPEGQYPWLERCPECGTYYTYFHALGYMEDDIKLERLSDEGARLLLALGISDRELSDKVKASLTPVLKERGFRLVYRANPWAWYHWRDECVQLIEVRTVDRHGFYAGYCRENGFPRRSLLFRCGVFYEFMPTRRAFKHYAWPALDQEPVKRLEDGRPHPVLRDFQASVDLACPSAPSQSSAIWRVEQNGGNLTRVLADATNAILTEGLAWLEKMSDLPGALQELDQQVDRDRAAGRLERDRLLTANYLAIKLGDQNKVTEYDTYIRQERSQQ
jgi:hypothetical protein